MPLTKFVEDERISNRTLYCLSLYTINHAYWLGLKGFLLINEKDESKYFENLIEAKIILKHGMLLAFQLPGPLKSEAGVFGRQTMQYLKCKSYESCHNTHFSDPGFSLMQHLNSVVMPCLMGGIYKGNESEKGLMICNSLFRKKMENLVRLIRVGGFVNKFAEYIDKVEVLRSGNARKLSIMYSLILDDYKQLISVILRKNKEFKTVVIELDDELRFLMAQTIYSQINLSTNIINSIKNE